MLFDRLGSSWANYRNSLGAVRALVVDDEEVICMVLTELLEDEGFVVETAADAETAWEKIQNATYDLLVTDKNLPRLSGLDLLAQVQAKQLDLPSVMITGFASIPSVSEALRRGAADYIAKPFADVRHVVRRLKSVAERRAADKLFSVMVEDLKIAVTETTQNKEELQPLTREMFARKKELAGRLSVLVVDPNIVGAKSVASIIGRHGMSSEIVTSLDSAQKRLKRAGRPLVIVISLELPETVEFIDRVRAEDPLLEVLVTSPAPNLGLSLKAMSAGAADFVDLGVEGTEVLVARVSRLVDIAKRQWVHGHLVMALYRRVSNHNHPTARAIRDMLPAKQREYLDKAVGPPPELPSTEMVIELTDLLEDEPIPLRARSPSDTPPPIGPEADPTDSPSPASESHTATELEVSSKSSALTAHALEANRPPDSPLTPVVKQTRPSTIPEVDNDPTPVPTPVSSETEKKRSKIPVTGPPNASAKTARVAAHTVVTPGRRPTTAPPDSDAAACEPPATVAEGEAATAPDRRLFRRTPARLRVRFRDVAGRGTVSESRNISPGGLFIRSDHPIPLGSRVSVDIWAPHVPIPQPVSAEGEVVRYIIIAPDPNQVSGLGVKIFSQQGSPYDKLVEAVAKRHASGW